LKEKEAWMVAASLYKELIINDYPQVEEDEFGEEEEFC
jgi:hypothetical protein